MSDVCSLIISIFSYRTIWDWVFFVLYSEMLRYVKRKATENGGKARLFRAEQAGFGYG